MERCGNAGFRKPDAFLSTAGKSGKVSTGSSERMSAEPGLCGTALGPEMLSGG